MSEKNISYAKGKETQSVDIDFIKNEMAQILQIDNLSFLVGAGCSSNIIEGRETGIPSMKELYKNFFAQYPDFKVGNVLVKDKFNENLETLLEIMGAVQISNQIQMIDNEIDQKIKNIQLFLRKNIISTLQGKEVLQIYKDFYLKTVQKTRKTPINIFTTNYDLYNEMALDELGFSYNNGFTGTYKRKFNPLSYSYVFVENMNLNRDVWERVSTFYNLIKLHGSISWVKQDDEIWERDIGYIKDDETVMIYPTPMKDRSTLMTPYSDFFRNMENHLMRKNSTLIVMGYSFGDDHINRIIFNALAIPTFRLVIFGESPYITKIKDMGDTRITIINSPDKIHYFINMVNNVMPSVHPDMEETLNMEPVEKMLGSIKEDTGHE